MVKRFVKTIAGLVLRYEFGCKVSVSTTSRRGWFVGSVAIHGNPYDGHTLSKTLDQVKRMTQTRENVSVDRGYRGHDYSHDYSHDYKGDTSIHVAGRFFALFIWFGIGKSIYTLGAGIFARIREICFSVSANQL